VAIEIELAYTIRPGLDAVRDRRLVELYASTAVVHRRAIAAVLESPADTLYGLVGRLAPLLERLEARLDDREAERLAATRPDPLAPWRG
jgi:hypothetical protein